MLKTGEFTYGNPILRGNGNNIIIGKYCSIADAVVMDGGFTHETKFISTYPFHTWGGNSNIRMRGDIIIGNDVWLAENCMIMSGITIGDGAIVGARAVVTKSVEPYSVVAGSPAKVINMRFSDEQIQKLLEIKWWNWSDEKVRENILLLSSDNIDEFINQHYTKL